MLTLFHDYTDPRSAVAVARLQRLADEGVDVAFEPFELALADIVRPVDLDVLAAIDELSESAAAEGIELRRPSALPSTARAHLLGTVAESVDLGASWRQTCYAALWRDDADIGDPEVLVHLASRAGLDPEDAARALADPRALAELRRSSAQRRRDGVGGVPTILAQRTLVPGLIDEADLRLLASM